MPVANARMYSVAPGVKAAWRELFEWVLDRAELDWPVIDHDAPAPLSALWERDDLGLAMMCGLPFSQREPRATIVAAPIPSPRRYGGQTVYMTDIVVRAGSAYRTIDDTRGAVVGYTLPDSLSGGVAPKRFLEGIEYREEVNGLVTPRAVIDALVSGRIDVGPLDSYWHDLLRGHEPQLASRLRTIASTPPLPIPPLVATAPLADRDLQRLRSALSRSIEEPSLANARGKLLLGGFAFPDPAPYARLKHLARS
jgi:ABC-type phosphate/phosphonate transport system substrate-binding protein